MIADFKIVDFRFGLWIGDCTIAIHNPQSQSTIRNLNPQSAIAESAIAIPQSAMSGLFLLEASTQREMQVDALDTLFRLHTDERRAGRLQRELTL